MTGKTIEQQSEKYILYADDDPDDQQLLREAVYELDPTLDIVTVGDGLEMLQYLSALKSESEMPCLIIVDLNMPKMGGLDVLKYLKNHQHFKKIDVVVFSTSNQQHEIDEAITNGASDYIKKPVSIPQVHDITHRFISYCNPASHHN